MTQNPFKQLLNELLTADFQPVTLQLLENVIRIVNEPGVALQTYGEAFQTLEFLAQAHVVELVLIDTNKTAYKIRKL